jgi:hypothetical protein
MATQVGSLKVSGTLGELSFYNSVYGHIIRRKGGPSAKQIKTHKNFERVREHNEEFSDCAKAGKRLRFALNREIRTIKDHKIVWRLNQLIWKVKNCDKQSARGKRNVTNGLKTNEGKLLVKGFDLNSQVPMKEVLKKPVLVEKGSIVIKELVPKNYFKAPKSATHVKVRGISLQIDLETGLFTIQEDSLRLTLDRKKKDVILTPAKTKNKGFSFYLLQLVFTQEINQEDYELEEGRGIAFVNVEC